MQSLHRQYTTNESGTNFLYMFDWVFGFAWFIFLNTLMYEINKDIYTVEGDRENGNHTIPVKLGIRAAEGIITALAGVAMISAVLAYSIHLSHLPLYIISSFSLLFHRKKRPCQAGSLSIFYIKLP